MSNETEISISIDKLYFMQQNQILTDATVILTDDYGNRVQIFAHKVILARFDYFEKLFKMEPSNLCYPIKVPNARIVHGLIMKLYGQPLQNITMTKSLWICEIVRCYDFFGIDINIKFVQQLIKPDKLDELDFTDIDVKLFMNVASILNFDNDIMNIINHYYCDESYLRLFSAELLEKLISHNQIFWIGYITENKTAMIMDSNGKKMNLSPYWRCHVIKFSADGQLCGLGVNDDLIVINLVNEQEMSLPTSLHKNAKTMS